MTYEEKAFCVFLPPCNSDLSVVGLVVGNRHVERLIFVGHSPQKSPVISGSFAERALQHKIQHVAQDT